MLNKKDIERLDSIMAAVMQKREARGFDLPDRDENKIAEILEKWERSTADEHARWADSFR